MNTIQLNDILKIENLDEVRIRLNLTNQSYNALDYYLNNTEKMLIGNFHNSTDRIWFKENQVVIGLVQIENDDWLLVDISKITKSYNNLWDDKTVSGLHTFYEYEKLTEYEKYFGRLVVQFHKYQAFVTMKGENIDKFIVKEILPYSLDFLYRNIS